MTDEDIAVRLEAHDHEISSLKHRMNDQEKQAETLNDLVISVKELAINMRNMIDEQKKAGERLSKLENEPAENWKNAKRAAITAVVSALAGAAVTGIFVAILQSMML